jgi:hypothetical protein
MLLMAIRLDNDLTGRIAVPALWSTLGGRMQIADMGGRLAPSKS